MSGGNRSYIGKAQLRKPLYIECVKYNRQLKVKRFLHVSSQYHCLMSLSSGQARISDNNSFFRCQFFFLILTERG